jgi:hypothetical protein
VSAPVLAAERNRLRGARRTPRRAAVHAVHVADLALPASAGLWVAGVCQTHLTVPGPYGLPASLPLVFYAGIALLVLSAGAELARSRPSRWRMSAHAAVLVIMLYGTAPLVYPQGRYAWLYKTIGVVQYINAHGSLNRAIDIYQNWPGFFALAAWFDKLAGVSSPLAYAKWSPPVVELAALPLLYQAYRALSLSERQRWVALLLYSGSNWIGQDYFSPQAVGTLLSLGVLAIAARWLCVKNSDGQHRPVLAAQPRRATACCVLLVLVYFVLTFTHELSPYIVAIQLGSLALARLLRPWWLPVVLVAIAVGYMIPRFAYVNSHFGLLSSLGNFFGNAESPAHDGAISASERLTELCSELLSAFMWALALIGAWVRRRSRRTVLTLLVLAFSPVLVLGLAAYGQEAILRVYLFSLPWVAALAASALAPERSVAARSRALARAGGAIAVPLALAVLLALFFPAFYGDDSFNVMTTTEVATLASFMQNAAPGPIYCPNGNAPLGDTARYNLFPLEDIFGPHSLVGVASAPPDIANLIADNSLVYTNGTRPAYVLITSSMLAYDEEYGVTPPHNFAVLRSALAHSLAWRLVADQPGAMIYELPPVSFTP